MVRFIDLATGNVFDGSLPYVFWFEKEQSTNLLYIRKICILSNKSTLKCAIEDNDIFQLIDVNKIADIKDITVHYKSYKDIQEMISATYTSQGTPYKDFYIHMVYVLGHSASAGEYKCNVTIDDQVISVGADFYNENETLGINVANMGLDIPKDVQRAIYESNLREDSVDNILLNRKFKELLIQYMDIIANKGSYNSLLNSLSWFEYGDLVKIYDYWKHGDIDREMMYREDLKQIVDTKIREMLSTFQKTTYIGLYYGLQSIKKDSDGNIIYRDKNYFVKGDEDSDWLPARTQLNLSKDKDYILQIGEGDISAEEGESDEMNSLAKFIPLRVEGDNTIPEPLPELIPTTSLWSTVDLSLKMALLGNFFSTYFMPIHLDLLHSTIENIVYNDTIKIMPWVVNNRFDNFDSVQAFECSIKDGTTYYLNDVRCRVYPNTPFGAELEDVREEIPGETVECTDKNEHGDVRHQAYKEKDFDINGVEAEERAWSSKDKEGSVPTNDDQILFDSQYFNGVGSIIPIECTFKNVQIGCPFVEASILVYHNGESHLHQTTRLYNDQDEMKTSTRTMNFNVLLQDIGNYVFVVSFKTSDSKEFMRTFRFSVGDDIYQSVKPYLIKKKDYWEILDKFGGTDFSILQAGKADPAVDYSLGDYMYSLIRQDGTPNPHYRQFLATNVDALTDNISTNTCILYQPKFTPVYTKGIITGISNVQYYFSVTKKTDTGFETKTIDELRSDWNKKTQTPTYRTDTRNVEVIVKEIVSNLQAYLPSYIWLVQERYLQGGDDKTKLPYILGINREFTTDLDVVMLDKKKIGIIRGGKDLTLDLKMTINTRTLKPSFKCNHEKYVYVKLGKPRVANTIKRSTGDVAATKAKTDMPIGDLDAPFAIGDFVKQDDIAVQAVMETEYDWEWYSLTDFRKAWFVEKKEIGLPDGTKRKETDEEQIKRKEPADLAIIDNRVIHLKVDTKEGVVQYIDVDLSNLWRIDPSSPFDKDGNPKKFVLNGRQTMYRDPVTAVSCYEKRDGLNGQVFKTKYGEIWKREFFVPFFYDLEEVEDNTIRQDQVLCFFPDLKKIKGKNISDLGWQIINDTYDKMIVPKSAEGFNIYPIDPMLGRYDYKILIDKGYYNLKLKYELVDNADHNHIYESNSQFIVK